MARKVTGADDDAPKITAALFAKMRPMKEVTPGMVEAIKTARRGRPKVEEPKVVFTMRVSQKAHRGWATLASDKRKKLAAAFERSIFETAGFSTKARPTARQRHR
ncbi:MAG: hypothetical protein WDM81_18235 [Rhizomicrobium sp.]